MDLDYYGLTDIPFRLTPDDHFFYPSPEHRRALSHLLFGLSQGEGIIVITGEVGAGKTTLVEHLSVGLGSESYCLATILVPQGRPEDLFKLIAAGFKLDHQETSSTILLNLVEVLRRQKALGRRALLIVDEAQSIPFLGLEELRLLSNLAEHGRALLQIILLGQPQFRATIARGDFSQLRQRILASYHINALNLEDVQPYVEHRLRAAGWQSRPRFTTDSFTTIYTYTDGLPRRINRLCGRVLLHAALEQTEEITAAIIEHVALELDADLSDHQLPTRQDETANLTIEVSNDILHAGSENFIKLPGTA
jgi:general secretion pathway protein A